MDRRTLLAGMGALASFRAFAQGVPSPAGDVPHWSSPVIDMHFHLRSPGQNHAGGLQQNITHQQGAGVTAANLLTIYDASADVAALRAMAPAGMFPSWFETSDVTKPEAEAQFRAAIKDGARGFGEVKYHVAADSPQMHRVYAIAAELNVPVTLHFQDAIKGPPGSGWDTGVKDFANVLKAFPKTKFIAHGNAYWGYISADYADDVDYPDGPIVPGGIADKLLSDYPNLFAELSANSGNTALARDSAYMKDFLSRHQDRLHFGSDCQCIDGRGTYINQSPDFPTRMRGKCLARETLSLLTNLTTPEMFRKIAWTNAHRLIGLPA